MAYSDISRNVENWLILKFVFIHSKTLKVSEDDQIQCKHGLQVFLDEWDRIKQF